MYRASAWLHVRRRTSEVPLKYSLSPPSEVYLKKVWECFLAREKISILGIFQVLEKFLLRDFWGLLLPGEIFSGKLPGLFTV